MSAHALVADIPVSNVKDLDLGQGDVITTVVNICVTYNLFGVTLFCFRYDGGTSAIYLLPPCVVVNFFYLRTTLIKGNSGRKKRKIWKKNHRKESFSLLSFTLPSFLSSQFLVSNMFTLSCFM